MVDIQGGVASSAGTEAIVIVVVVAVGLLCAIRVESLKLSGNQQLRAQHQRTGINCPLVCAQHTLVTVVRVLDRG